MHQAVLRFNAGEVSPLLRHAIDLDKAPAAAASLVNFLVSPYGALIRRPGLHYLRNTSSDLANTRLLPFVASDGTPYLLHFKPEEVRIYRANDPAAATADNRAFMPGYVWPADPLAGGGIPSLQLVQVNDVAFIVHPGTFPLRLLRRGDNDWRLGFVPFDRPPMKDENTKKNRTFTVASNPVAPTWASSETYVEGNTVFTNCEWECVAAHTAGSANKPGTGADWRKFWKRKFFRQGDPVTILCDDREREAWSFLYRSYGLGFVGYRENTTSVYICIRPHTMAASYVGSGFSLHSSNFLADDPYGEDTTWCRVYVWADGEGTSSGWSASNGGQLCYHNGVIYRCIQNNADTPPAADREPGVGANWELFWEEFDDLGTSAMPNPIPTIFVSGQYNAGQIRSRKGRTFEAILQHRPEFSNRPPTGANWQTFWVEVSRMVESFTSGPFSPGMYFRISPERDEQDFQTEIEAIYDNDGLASEHIAVQGAWNFFTYGTWKGTFQLQRSANNGRNWETIRSWESKADRNIADSGVEDDPVLLRLKFLTGSTSSGDDPASATTRRGLLIPASPYVTGYALCDTYVDSDEMTGFAHTAMLSGSTYRWAECAFNSRDGFPRAVALHESRVVFGGTAAQPVSLWFSQTDDFLNFETGPDPTDGIAATLAASAASPILWLASQRRLFIGTLHAEWAVGSETRDEAIAPTSFLARPYTRFGSAPIAPAIGGDEIHFLQRSAGRLRTLAFDDSSGSYAAPDLTRLAEHLAAPGIRSMAFQSVREPALWMVRRDGTLLHLAHNPAERLTAFSRHTTPSGTFVEVCVIPNPTGDDDVFFLVNRGGTLRLERFPRDWFATIEAGGPAHHLDGVFATPSAPVNIPSHLRNITLTVQSGQSVTSQVFGNENTTASTGRPYSSTYTSLPIDHMGQDGTTQGRTKRAHKALLSLYQSAGGRVWNADPSSSQPITYPASAAFPHSGWTETVLDTGHLTDVSLSISSSEPFPLVVRSAVLRFNIHER